MLVAPKVLRALSVAMPAPKARVKTEVKTEGGNGEKPLLEQDWVKAWVKDRKALTCKKCGHKVPAFKLKLKTGHRIAL